MVSVSVKIAAMVFFYFAVFGMFVGVNFHAAVWACRSCKFYFKGETGSF